MKNWKTSSTDWEKSEAEMKIKIQKRRKLTFGDFAPGRTTKIRLKLNGTSRTECSRNDSIVGGRFNFAEDFLAISCGFFTHQGRPANLIISEKKAASWPPPGPDANDNRALKASLRPNPIAINGKLGFFHVAFRRHHSNPFQSDTFACRTRGGERKSQARTRPKVILLLHLGFGKQPSPPEEGKLN
jgi:hypothetical protein